MLGIEAAIGQTGLNGSGREHRPMTHDWVSRFGLALGFLAAVVTGMAATHPSTTF